MASESSCDPSSTPNPSPNQEPNPPPSHDASSTDGTVRIGVGNTSSSNINIEVTDNLVARGRHGVHLGSGNHAAGDNTGFISGNTANCDALLIGVDNYSEGGNNDIRVYNNDFQGFKSVQVGVGNYARGSNTIIVGSLGGPPNGPNSSGTGAPSRPRPQPQPQPPTAPSQPQPPRPPTSGAYYNSGAYYHYGGSYAHPGGMEPFGNHPH